MARITMENLPDLALFQRRSHANSTRLAIVSNADSTRLARGSNAVSTQRDERAKTHRASSRDVIKTVPQQSLTRSHAILLAIWVRRTFP